ncbi:cyclin-dependent kinase inhibitor 1B-like [Dreissena polymorpha]|uniref:cyclin-dependent kinase inhibitor 1B-like n=1 Tax=Dreissena polymorpha TaxID=45954 RepID=UPI002264AE01|nr:cyclin-dependent kinase inhibitor 1B-like [Dreissena polymorpha]
MDKSHVCRCLFGMPDHNKLKAELQAQLKQTNSVFKNKWNYDEDLDQVMEGRYQWSEVPATEYVPEFYRKGYRKTKFRSRLDIEPKSRIALNFDNVPNKVTNSRIPVITSPSASEEKAESMDLQRENETTPEARVVRQTKIDEFMKVKKRRLDHSDSDSDTDLPPSKRRGLRH